MDEPHLNFNSTYSRALAHLSMILGPFLLAGFSAAKPEENVDCIKFVDGATKNRLTIHFPYDIFDQSNYSEKAENVHYSAQYLMEGQAVSSFFFEFSNKSSKKMFILQRKFIRAVSSSGISAVDSHCFYSDDRGFFVLVKPARLLKDFGLIRRMGLTTLLNFLSNLLTLIKKVDRENGVLVDWSVKSFLATREELETPLFEGFDSFCVRGHACDVSANTPLGKMLADRVGHSEHLAKHGRYRVNADRRWNCMAFLWLTREYLRRYIDTHASIRNFARMNALDRKKDLINIDVCLLISKKDLWPALRAIIEDIRKDSVVDKDSREIFKKSKA